MQDLPRRSRPAILPRTTLGKSAVALFGAYLLLSFSWRLLGPLGAFPSFLCAIAGGVVAMIAIVRRHERALAVFASVLPLLSVLLFIAAELLIGHD